MSRRNRREHQEAPPQAALAQPELAKKARVRAISIGAIAFCVGLGIGFGVSYLFSQSSLASATRALSEDTTVRAGGYSFINPIISCDISENKAFDEYAPIADKLEAYINQNISEGNAQDVSVYFRGLNSSNWSGVNENDLYSPASLLKVPILIAYLKLSETQTNILNTTLTYHQTTDENAAEVIKPAQSIQDGQTYTITDLLRYMIVYSDNNAATLLTNNIDTNSLDEVYSDLGLQFGSSLTDATISAKSYSYVFRVLYNAGYLRKKDSQYALQLLSETAFTQGISAGVASNIPIAQKFGERTSETYDPTTLQTTVDFRELHDCGIIYYPDNPYLLCVMTKGTDFSKLETIISSISQLIYQETASGVLKF